MQLTTGLLYYCCGEVRVRAGSVEMSFIGEVSNAYITVFGQHLFKLETIGSCPQNENTKLQSLAQGGEMYIWLS